MKHQSRKHQSAFTLIETVVSLGLMTIIMLGLSAIMMIGSKAIPSTTDTGLVDQQIISALNQMRSDLRRSSTITHSSAVAGDRITLSIKPTGTRGEPTTVMYQHTVASNTITRTTDLKSEQILLENLDGFAISFTTEVTDATVANITLVNTNSIQYYFEVYAALPDKPEYK
jgi:Tfp pilus assembly protein PilV